MTRIQNQEKQNLARQFMAAYNPSDSNDILAAIKDLMGGCLESMLQAELDNHLGYSNNSKDAKQTANRRNGYGKKTVKSTLGEIEINVPRDRDGSFDPQVVEKRQRDISEIEGKVLALYGRGTSERDIAETIKDIYGFNISHTMISSIIDKVMPEVEEWRNRTLASCYPFVFVDCLYVTMRVDGIARETAVYVALGYDLAGKKDILGLWLNESESKTYWMQIFDELKARGVEDIFFICMDGVSGLEAGAKAVYPQVVVQRCIVHLIRNSLRYVPSRDYKDFTRSLKKVYGALNLKMARAAFEEFKQQWQEKYPGAVAVWERNFKHVEQLFDYGSAVRKVMYTTNAVESVNASLRKVTKKGAFPNENALYKALYLRIQELLKKWTSSKVQNWSYVLNQLMINDSFRSRIDQHLKKLS